MVYLDIQLEEENDSAQHSLDQHFQNEFSYLVTNQLVEECEEVSVKDESDLVNDTTASRQQSDSKHSLQLETQGELQIFGFFNLVNDVDYEVFLFPISMHESSLDFDSQFCLCSHEHADVFSHSEHEDEMVFEFYMHYENE